MIINSVRLENFGLYTGYVEFDLTPKNGSKGKRPLIIIGGRNGAGKTTLLEAVRLALYGRRSLGARVSQAEYNDYLRGKVSRTSTNNRSSVTLEFEYSEAAKVNRYRVTRAWSIKGGSVNEDLLLEKNGKVIDEIPQSEWHQFLQELIPPGVSQLFFFDGEKISEIAEGENDSEQLAEAVKSLIGVDLISSLRIDLGVYLARNQRDDNKVTLKRLEELDNEIKEYEEKIRELIGDLAELNSQRESQARFAERIRRQFVAEGGDAAANRTHLENERDDIRRLIHRLDQEIKELSNKLLPFAMAPKLIAAFGAAIKSSAVNSDDGYIERMRNTIQEWRLRNYPVRNAKWLDKHWNDLEQFIIAQAPSVSTGLIPALKEVGDGAATLNRLSELDEYVKPRAVSILHELEDALDREKKVMEALERADNANQGVLLEELRKSEQQYGATQEKYSAKEKELKLLRGQLSTIQREQKKMLEEQTQVARTQERLSLAARVSDILLEFEAELLNKKIKQLRGEFVSSFNRLVRKKAFIGDIHIDPKTFETDLIDLDGKIVPKSSLSAGEKQIYAISVLWALAKTSGRPLPMIVDTPLGRLDSIHRMNLIDHYFPAASHQVILLSTDTEIDDVLAERMRPSISHTYHLEYSPETKSSSATLGYFKYS